ncbi:MAG: PIN domain-containing protein [Pyrinomonadaceae bacterium]
MSGVDTNILIYTHDPRDAVKQNKAANLIASLTDGVLLWQVACEYVAASRKLAAFGLNEQKAFTDLERLRNVWKPLLPTWEVLEKAEKLLASGNFSFWDALIIAACVENGVTKFYSEDMDSSQSERTGVMIINPFV